MFPDSIPNNHILNTLLTSVLQGLWYGRTGCSPAEFYSAFGYLDGLFIGSVNS